MKKLFNLVEAAGTAAIGAVVIVVVLCGVAVLCGAGVLGAAGVLTGSAASRGEPAAVGAAGAAGSWGLSFQAEGEAPVANCTSEYLEQFGGYYMDVSGAKEKKIYLTFDSGYENGYMEKILDVLKEEEVTAAFFVVGNYIRDNGDLVKRMAKEGHIVGNHTMNHPDMSQLENNEEFESQLKQLEEAYKDVTGADMKKYYRPPQGNYSESNLMNAKKLGYKTIFWSLAYVDWMEDKQPTREDALNTLNNRIHDGAIVLLHSTSKTNSEILSELIEGWKSRGYTFGSLDELK